MIDKNSPIFIACRPSGIIAILLAFGIGILLSNSVSADFLNSEFNSYCCLGDCSHRAECIGCPIDWIYLEGYGYNNYNGVCVASVGGLGNSKCAFFHAIGELSQEVYFNYNDNITFWARTSSGIAPFYVYADNVLLDSFSVDNIPDYYIVNTFELSGYKTIKFNTTDNSKIIYLDNVHTVEGYLANNINFNPNTLISNQTHQYFDYVVNNTWNDYYYFVTSVWEPDTYNLHRYENWLNVDMSGENIQLQNEFNSYSNYTLNLYATTYPYLNIGYAHLIATSPIIQINESYIPPTIPEEPDEPEIPDPEPEPDPEPDLPIPPTQPNETGANQSINVSWTGEYYNAVNNTFGGLCSPIYNFTNWSLSPIYSLNNSIGEFNYHMNESFTQTAQDSSILYESINTIFSAIHPKIRNVITYYLIWVVLLIVLKKG